MGKKKKLKFKDLADPKKFLWLVADAITPNDILYLSGLDYGFDKDKHAERISYFKRTLCTSKLESWYPMEVWELNRWSSPDYLDSIGHSRRAFSCAGILAYYFDNKGEPTELFDTVLPLFESLIRLDFPDWRKYFYNFLSEGVVKMKYPEDKFKLQLVVFLTIGLDSEKSGEIRDAYDKLMEHELSHLKYEWEHMWNETWDSALEPTVERPDKIVDTNITHGTAHMFAAKYVYHKAEKLTDNALEQDLKNLARRIALLGNDDIDEYLPASTIYL